MMPVADIHTNLRERVLELKQERNAVILAHSYQTADIQEVADYVGDSLGLAYQARETDAEVILFCGVHFMAETAKIVNPDIPVLLPDLDAGCSLADSCPAEELKETIAKNPGLYVVAYINCSAEVKATSDVICTSGNAKRIVERIPEDREILFVPDRNLGEWVQEQTGRQMQMWKGDCYVHIEFTHESIRKLRRQYPEAPIVAHPECTRAVRMLADEVCSTEKMIGYCRDSDAETFIIVTESGMMHRLKRELPSKTFIPGPTDKCACADCQYMKMNTLEKILSALETMEPQIRMDETIQARARIPLERMLEWSR